MSDHLDQLLDIYAGVAKVDRDAVDPSLSLEEIPSLDRLELLFEIEDAFDIQVPYDELDEKDRPRTLADFAGHVEKLVAESRG